MHYRKRLEEPLVITQLRREVMPADYARILHKQSKVFRTQANSSSEATMKKAQAAALLATKYDASCQIIDQADERTYDNQVYVLWR